MIIFHRKRLSIIVKKPLKNGTKWDAVVVKNELLDWYTIQNENNENIL